MSPTPARNSSFPSHLVRTLTLSLAAITIVGVTSIASANAWYDAYGYWHRTTITVITIGARRSAIGGGVSGNLMPAATAPYGYYSDY